MRKLSKKEIDDIVTESVLQIYGKYTEPLGFNREAFADFLYNLPDIDDIILNKNKDNDCLTENLNHDSMCGYTDCGSLCEIDFQEDMSKCNDINIDTKNTDCLTKKLNCDDMFEFNGMFEGKFGKIAPGMCRLTMNGGIAVKTHSGYKTYNLKKDTLTNVTNFCFSMGDEMFFVIPTTKAETGDIILIDGKPKCVIKADRKRIEVIDYETSEVKTVVPERHIFMGSVYFYGKIVSMFSGAFKSGKGMNNMIKMMMMSQMFGGNSAMPGMSGNNMGQGLSQLMMMQFLMGNNDNPFNEMFEGMGFDTADEDELEDDADVNGKE